MCKRCVLISKRSDFQYGTNFVLEERQNPPALTKGCVTGASQDHLVGFHKLTISTGQGNIRKLLNISHNSEAELTVWSPKLAFSCSGHFCCYWVGWLSQADLQIMDEFCP